jgi:4-amino-4-deoxy-L-arabinose transferase-like glycosyltransferase
MSVPFPRANSRVLSLTSPTTLLASILVIAALFRLWNIGGPSLWADELYSLGFSRVPLDMLWSEWMVRETNPPLYYTILKTWTAVFGNSDISVRALSVVAGLAAIVALFAFVRAMHSYQAGLYVAGLAAVSSLQNLFSNETRAYIFGALAATLTLLALVRLIDQWRGPRFSLKRSAPWLALYVSGSWVAFHVHTTLFILPLLSNLVMAWIFWFRTERRPADAAAWFAANVLLALACSWWILMTVAGIRAGAAPIEWIPKPNLKDAVAITSHLLATRSFSSVNVVLAVLMAPIAIWGLSRLQTERRALIVTFAIGAPLLLIAISFVRPIFLERTVFWVNFVYLTALAVGLATLPIIRARIIAAALIGFVFIADTLATQTLEFREPFRKVAQVLREQAGANDLVLVWAPDPAVQMSHYCLREGCGPASWASLESSRDSLLVDFSPAMTVKASELPTVLARYDKVYVLTRRPWEDPRPALSGIARLKQADTLFVPNGKGFALSVWEPVRGTEKAPGPS